MRFALACTVMVAALACSSGLTQEQVIEIARTEAEAVLGAAVGPIGPTGPEVREGPKAKQGHPELVLRARLESRGHPVLGD